ncbi:hypothetical protein [Desulfococcus sp.]
MQRGFYGEKNNGKNILKKEDRREEKKDGHPTRVHREKGDERGAETGS